jgi:hypothetical protein
MMLLKGDGFESEKIIARLCSLVFVLSQHDVYSSACVLITNETFCSHRASNITSR